jgi:hypothetical protein
MFSKARFGNAPAGDAPPGNGRDVIRLAAVVACLFAVAQWRAPAGAMPIFAQRYELTCKTCHSVMPELNAFGTVFRAHNYRLPKNVTRHGTTIVAWRYNLDYAKDPAPGSRRFTPSSSILSQADFGAVSAYLHYGLGAGGGPGAPFLGFLSYRNDNTATLYRLGLYELPLTHSPGQRLDDLSSYGYEGASVGQNDLALNAPRLGLESERKLGQTNLALSVAFGEFKGAAYGGAPVDTGSRTVAADPELGLFADTPLTKTIQVNASAIEGTRNILLVGKDRPGAYDAYTRLNAGVRFTFLHDRLELQGQQWLGHDDNADGAGNPLDTSGGWVRLRYFATPHLFIATRLDAQANPIASRKLVLYAGGFLTPHAHLIVQRSVDLTRGIPEYEAGLVIAAPWPARL